VLVRLVGGPLGRRELRPTRAVGRAWLVAGDAGWGVYIPAHREPVTGIALARARPHRVPCR